MEQQKENGIILLEAIIAIGVLVTVFTAAMALYMTSVKGVRVTNDQVIATYLAQDAMEYVIAKRQYNYEQSHTLDWLDGIDHCSVANPCEIDFYDNLSDSLVQCGSCQLYLDGDGVYNPNGGDVTHFQRSISYESVNSYTARIRARVWWMDGGNSNEYVLVHTMYANPN